MPAADQPTGQGGTGLPGADDDRVIVRHDRPPVSPVAAPARSTASKVRREFGCVSISRLDDEVGRHCPGLAIMPDRLPSGRWVEPIIRGSSLAPMRKAAHMPQPDVAPPDGGASISGRDPLLLMTGGVRRTFATRPPDIDAGEQEQPHHVDEMPVPGSELEAEMLGRSEMAEKRADQAHDQER